MKSFKSDPNLEVKVPSYDYSLFGKTEERPLDQIRQIVGNRMTASWKNVPHVTHHDEVDVTLLEDRRKKYNEAGDIPLSPLSYLMKATLDALKEFPDFNSSLDEDGKTLHVKSYYNIGIAVDTTMGLIVPVLKNANALDLVDLAKATANLAEKARSGKLTFADTEGGSFTITSLGPIGGTAFTPIINAPEVAILGVSRIRRKPVEWRGDIALRMMLPLSLSYDHRVIDGAMAARFMGFIRDTLEAGDILPEVAIC